MRVPTYTFSEEELTGAVARVLTDETIRTRVAAAGRRLRQTSGTALAADLIEQLADTREPVHRHE